MAAKKEILTNLSLLLKGGIAVIFLAATLFLCAAATGGNEYSAICFGPFILLFGLVFISSVIWILQELKEKTQ